MSDNALLQRPLSLFIDGKWRAPANADPLTVVDPSTGQTLARIDGGDAADANDAVTAASAASI